MKRLIVNADDFGLHSEVNKAIIQGYQRGCIRSTSLMPTGAAVEEASQLARENPWLGIGIHLTLVAENPLLPRDKVSTLLAANGKFHADHMVFIKNYLLGSIDKGQLLDLLKESIRMVMSRKNLPMQFINCRLLFCFLPQEVVDHGGESLYPPLCQTDVRL